MKYLAALIASLAGSGALAQNLPSGGSFQMGSGTVVQEGTAVNVTVDSAHTNSRNAVIDWSGGFNVGSGHSANFHTTDSGLRNLINIDQSGSLSSIQGQVNIGNIPNWVLVNPNGITLGSEATLGGNALSQAVFATGTVSLNPTSGVASIHLGTSAIDITPGATSPAERTSYAAPSLGREDSGVVFLAPSSGVAVLPHQERLNSTGTGHRIGASEYYTPLDLSALEGSAFITPANGNTAVIAANGQTYFLEAGAELSLHGSGAVSGVAVLVDAAPGAKVRTHETLSLADLTIGEAERATIAARVGGTVRFTDEVKLDGLRIAQELGYTSVEALLIAFGYPDVESLVADRPDVLAFYNSRVGSGSSISLTLGADSRIEGARDDTLTVAQNVEGLSGLFLESGSQLNVLVEGDVDTHLDALWTRGAGNVRIEATGRLDATPSLRNAGEIMLTGRNVALSGGQLGQGGVVSVQASQSMEIHGTRLAGADNLIHSAGTAVLSGLGNGTQAAGPQSNIRVESEGELAYQRSAGIEREYFEADLELQGSSVAFEGDVRVAGTVALRASNGAVWVGADSAGASPRLDAREIAIEAFPAQSSQQGVTGRDVLITGSEGRLIAREGTLSIQAHSGSVQAEGVTLQAGSDILVGARDVLLENTRVLGGQGGAAQAVVAGSGDVAIKGSLIQGGAVGLSAGTMEIGRSLTGESVVRADTQGLTLSADTVRIEGAVLDVVGGLDIEAREVVWLREASSAGSNQTDGFSARVSERFTLVNRDGSPVTTGVFLVDADPYASSWSTGDQPNQINLVAEANTVLGERALLRADTGEIFIEAGEHLVSATSRLEVLANHGVSVFSAEDGGLSSRVVILGVHQTHEPAPGIPAPASPDLTVSARIRADESILIASQAEGAVSVSGALEAPVTTVQGRRLVETGALVANAADLDIRSLEGSVSVGALTDITAERARVSAATTLDYNGVIRSPYARGGSRLQSVATTTFGESARIVADERVQVLAGALAGKRMEATDGEGNRINDLHGVLSSEAPAGFSESGAPVILSAGGELRMNGDLVHGAATVFAAIGPLPAEIHFEDTVSGQTRFADVTIHNKGLYPANMGEVEILGEDFTVVEGCASLSAGASCTIRIAFSPDSAGEVQGRLRVSINEESFETPMVAKGLADEAPVTPEPVEPEPVEPEPVEPEPEVPGPVAPEPEIPEPVEPEPEPEPEVPEPVEPDPVEPEPVTPEPVEPEPDPEVPDPVAPDPEVPGTVEPAPPVTPAPEPVDPVPHFELPGAPRHIVVRAAETPDSGWQNGELVVGTGVSSKGTVQIGDRTVTDADEDKSWTRRLRRLFGGQ